MDLLEPICEFVNNIFQSFELFIFLLLSFGYFSFDGGYFLFLKAMDAGRRKFMRNVQNVVYNEDEDFEEPINLEEAEKLIKKKCRTDKGKNTDGVP